MEKLLSQWIRETKKGGVLVETWVISDEDKDIMHKLYSLQFPGPSEFSNYPFKFSNNW